MKTSTSIIKIAPAILKAQKNIGAATKGASNPFFKSKYADLPSVMEACKESFNDAGISILQPVGFLDGFHIVETVLLHESGEFISESMKLELTKTNMQDLGSAISYAKRYSLQSMGFIPSEDDDAESSMDRSIAKKVAKVIAETSQTSVNTETVETSKEEPKGNGSGKRSTFKRQEPGKTEEWN